MLFFYIFSFFLFRVESKGSRKTSFSSAYKETELILDPILSDRLAYVTEILITLNLNNSIVDDILSDHSSSNAYVEPALIQIGRRMKKLIKFLFYEQRMRKLLLPRISDQTSIYTKLLAKYRVDNVNPWATQILLSCLPDSIKSTFNFEDYSGTGLKRKLERSAKLRSLLQESLGPYLVDNSAPLFEPRLFRILQFFLKFDQNETEEILCQMVLGKTGISVKSIEEINDLFITEPKIPKTKNSCTSLSIYAQAPFIHFQLKSTN